MLKLRVLLLSKYLYVCLIAISISYTILKTYYIKPPPVSNHFIGVITSIKYKNNSYNITVKNKYQVLVISDYKYKLTSGDKISITGEFKIPKKNSNLNGFNYQKYLLSEDIFYTTYKPKINFLKTNNNILYNFKDTLTIYLNKLPESTYLKTFILADTTDIEEDIKDSYRINGISHLMAISGAQIALIAVISLFILKPLNIRLKYLITNAIIWVFTFITSFNIAVVRASIAFIFISFNKVFDFKISGIQIWILTISTNLLINPFSIYNVGFWYSYIVSLFLILYHSSYSKNVLRLNFQISFIASLASLPITVYYFYYFNAAGIVYNLLYVPLISFIVYPLTLITLVIKPFSYILTPLINLTEITSLKISNINFFILSFPKPTIIVVILYYLWLINYALKPKINKLLVLIFFYILTLASSINYSPEIYIIDVGQGDSIFIRTEYNKKTYLIDTGGDMFLKDKHYDAKNIISFLKSIGVNKLDYLILTHGDFDHMGDSMYLIDNFKVNNILLNNNQQNHLEKKIAVKYQHKLIHSISNKHLKTLTLNMLPNENESSTGVYIKFNNYSFLTMGDLGYKKEEELVDKYNLKNITILKLSHHGSKHSTSDYLIKTLKPKYSLISVGENNNFNHPNKEVLEKVKKSKLYRTDEDGMIKIKLGNKLTLETIK